jgi:hypothetical protein
MFDLGGVGFNAFGEDIWTTVKRCLFQGIAGPVL